VEPYVSLLEWGFGQVHAEKMDGASSAEPLLLQKDGRKLRLTGIVDRIDVDNERGTFRVTDYKLSSAPSFEQIENGDELQLALYLLAYQSASRELGLRPAGGRYAVIRNPSAKSAISFDNHQEFKAWAERVTERVFELERRLAHGDVSPKPRDMAECSRCSFRYVCRRDDGVAMEREEAYERIN
jgi:ATP-dependent helicase/DNAse subunit B